MSIDDRIVTVKRAVEKDLRRHANAHAVAIGLKFVNGKSTGDLAIQVFVERKRPLLDLPEAERVPREIEGIQTDVIEMSPPAALADTAMHRPLRGGTQIASLPGPTLPDGTFPDYSGTLGCIASSNEPDGSTRIVALTNYHVLMNPPNQIGSHAGQPDVAGCGDCCDNVIGTILRAERQNGGNVDAAIVALNPGQKWMAEIIDIGPVSGVHAPIELSDIVSTNGYPVKKSGKTTGLTTGRIVSVHKSGDLNDEHGAVMWSYVDQMLIDGGFSVFSDHGDSGSIIVNDGNEAVGLLWGGGGNGGWASPIGFVETQLGISICTAAEQGVVNTVPGSTVQSHRTWLGGEVVHSFVQSSAARMDAVSRSGVDVDRWLRHTEEVKTLILTNRRLAAAWRRLRGPDVFRLIVGELSEVSVSDMKSNLYVDFLDSFLALLNRYGSDSLRADLPEFRRVCDQW